MKENLFEVILSEFKSRENPEAILFVGDDQNLIKVVLSWPNILIEQLEELPEFYEDWNEVEKWQWLWQCICYRQHDLEAAVGSRYNLDKMLSQLIANRILYPDGTVHSYVTRYLRDRVVKLFESKPRAKRTSKTTN